MKEAKELDENFFSVEEFAKKLSVHPNTIRRAIKRGKIQAIDLGTSLRPLYRIPSSEVNRMAIFDMRKMVKQLVNEAREEEETSE